MGVEFEVPAIAPDRIGAWEPVEPWVGEDPAVLVADVESAAGTVRFAPQPDLDLDGTRVWVTPVEPGYRAADLWTTFRQRYASTGLWPVLTNSYTWSTCALAGPPALADVDAQRWLAAELDARHAEAEAEEDDDDPIPRDDRVTFSADDLTPDRHLGFDWSDVWSIVGDELDQLALVPVRYPWDVPGRLAWDGACNHDIDAGAHAAVLRRWTFHWDTELVALELGTMWLRTGRAITTRDEALTAALEAFAYCSDSVYQDHDTLDALAHRLLQPVWRLWWD
ncbi:DUF4253 domain-containing protein [Nocardia puris]|uniref:DUF4253 domain-containing protein n=1 Tax=Nocardia puris TaxID=208602 RepID=UPI001895B0BF|nr:DUF4253 domain-containing protein [Nocardia puris]MBF6209544.1 DUF4253 domain-containing protein [Nocardia puris]MBF6366116.1 DUF4253 domain-containing protein [Nocardia puris]MBF6458543.1 DUF4253 domain-containing protein [Nocardia puris]